VTPKFNSPAPVTRQVDGTTHSTTPVHGLTAVVMTLPLMSYMHGAVVLARAVPCAVTVKLVPGHATSMTQTWVTHWPTPRFTIFVKHRPSSLRATSTLFDGLVLQ